MAKVLRFWLAAMAAAVILCLPAAALYKPYTYSYNYWGKAVASPDAYTAQAVWMGPGEEALSSPGDLFIAQDGTIYVADTGNNRIVVYDNSGTFLKTMSDFTINGEASPLNEPGGLFVNAAGELLIADTQNKRVIRANEEGQILQEYVQPGEGAALSFSAIDFLPLKVLEDHNGYVYVLCQDVVQGALLYEPDGVFSGYYGANQVEFSFQLLSDMFWRRFMTQEQRSKMTKYVPYEYNNFAIDAKGFIYTCTELSENAEGQLRKLNPKGVNVLPLSMAVAPDYRGKYGDPERKIANGEVHASRLTDVVVDSDGFITALDYSRGRLFQYDAYGNLLYAFGGLGDQAGTFRKPVAVDAYGGRLYVLDETKGSITVFAPTPYGELLRSAVLKYNGGDFAASEQDWNAVLQMNSNLGLANISIGKIYYENGDYKTAMMYFKRGEDRDDYGDAFKLYRNQILRTIGFPVIGVIVAAAVVLKVVLRLCRLVRRRRERRTA